jgi:hypothetical protein
VRKENAMRPLPRHPALLAFLLIPGLAGAAEITTAMTRLDVKADGSGTATTEFVVTGAASESIDIPLSSLGGANLRLGEGPEGLNLEIPKAKAVAFHVTLPPVAGASKFTVRFDVPEAFAKPEDSAAGAKLTMPRESRTLKVTFLNAQATLVKDLDILVTLPEGYRVQAVREALPKLKKTEVEPRVRLGAADGRQNALLQMMNLKQGDSLSMQIEAVPNRRSLLWLVAGIVLSGLYLVQFRDLVARNADPTKTR